MQRLLALLLVLLGLIGLVLGRLGDTVWAPATETTATVQLSDPGPAVVIDPGVLYIGGTEGEVEMEVNWALEDHEVAAGIRLACQSRPLTEKVTVDFDI